MFRMSKIGKRKPEGEIEKLHQAKKPKSGCQSIEETKQKENKEKGETEYEHNKEEKKKNSQLEKIKEYGPFLVNTFKDLSHNAK